MSYLPPTHHPCLSPPTCSEEPCPQTQLGLRSSRSWSGKRVGRLLIAVVISCAIGGSRRRPPQLPFRSGLRPIRATRFPASTWPRSTSARGRQSRRPWGDRATRPPLPRALLAARHCDEVALHFGDLALRLRASAGLRPCGLPRALQDRPPVHARDLTPGRVASGLAVQANLRAPHTAAVHEGGRPPAATCCRSSATRPPPQAESSTVALACMANAGCPLCQQTEGAAPCPGVASRGAERSRTGSTI